ncbi:DNA helicase RecQ [Mesorhizobium sp. M4B.F.Ca.ET.215.01.1.1]|uniref:DNA helicase RecQ n=1 Tax=unclassified Mesorhizobium TaxID=325217 RepID=UPI000FCA7103|nr:MULTISPECIES: DNA helicase RecQ [unclassified Mesorhizobium]RUW28011.1 DNA helicase RecQ [Mesorhizobium sp. M4B.F.Ca.ET.013.02.1.1]RVD46613.1 DNA helicase RecQ [Mesorhizobium sp. M4B.F.Ca.ET.019.03.1.1]TGQ10798.1 DNA helicase RecQ [Mesorhizobium sp. M4B.F.Ca.ET.215.01.1.1]TGQ36375.1 DNA helicase RecQ [Mesorhizobium sp. M4B.F.Ca.ET.214.01.1.1]TGQ38303.1 DNA helicase RecQ [Mesorhizobium sp. M00.F.Ca.ET.220.01.1.1]
MHRSAASVPADGRDAKHRVLKDVFGFDDFRPGQAAVMEALLAGRHVLAVMPTGAGKSLCYQVPALVLGGLTIVVSPLVALMQDQVAALRLAGVTADTINSSLDRDANVAAWRRVASGQTRLLYLAPERLMTERMLDALARLDVRLIAVDEAHCISQWGPAFRREYEDLSRLGGIFPDVPVIALTATADEGTRADIEARLFAGRVETLVLGFDRPNIKLAIEAKQDSKRQLLRFVERHPGRSGIVYCLSRRKTEEMAAFLEKNGVTALAYHAGMSKEAREANQNAFMTLSGVVMVATIAFGMGIDKPDVAYVFHTDLPGSLEAYYQEIGRAGRDGRAAEAHMLFGLGDIRTRRMFIDDEDAAPEHKRRSHGRLDTLIGYCETAQCRRQVLLGYFGEQAEPCGNCDNCLEQVPRADGSAEARLILAAVAQSGERFGAAHVIDILLGHETEKVLARSHQRLASFGTGMAHKRPAWLSLIRQLVAGGFLMPDPAGHGGLAIADSGHALGRGEGSFEYRVETRHRSMRGKARSAEGGGADMEGVDTALLATLKTLRLRLAKERQVPAYVVFSDRTLIDMADRRPRDLDAFAEVNGVGEAKLREFGEVFLETIAGHGSGA